MSRLPDRPSLEQLRKQAKDLLKQLRNGDPSALERLRKHKPANVSDPILADAQFVLAREHGFESWPKLFHYLQTPEIEDHRRSGRHAGGLPRGVPFLMRLPHVRELSIGGCPKVTRSAMRGFASSVRVNYDPR
jgi:hypothetical protein